MRALGRRDSYAREYLAQTILAGLTAEELVFLQSTATLDTLTGDLCDSLLGVRNSQGLLTDLSRRGVVVPAEAGPGFCMPEVLRTHLLAAMREDLGDEVTDDWLCETAAVIAHEDGGNGAAAVRTYVATRTRQAAIGVVIEQWQSVMGDADLDWVDACPRGVRRSRGAGRACGAGPARRVPGDRCVVGPRTGHQGVTRWGRCRQGHHPVLPEMDGRRPAARRALERLSPRGGAAPQPRSPHRAAVSAHADVLQGLGARHRRIVVGRCAVAAQLRKRLEDDPVTSCAVELLATVLAPAGPERADAIAAHRRGPRAALVRADRQRARLATRGADVDAAGHCGQSGRGPG